ERVAFWQPTPAEPQEINPGERWYFKALGAPVILGYGEFLGWEELTAKQLFAKYGPACGYVTPEALLAGLRVFNPDLTEDAVLGNIVLEHFTTFDPPVALTSVHLTDLSVRYRYLRDSDPIAAYVGGFRPERVVVPFALRDQSQARQSAQARKLRLGQSSF